MKMRISLIICLFIFCSCNAGDKGTVKQIFLISLDTVRWDHTDLSRYERSTMPNLKKIAEAGIYFTEARANSTFTTPSHMTMLTGYLPKTHNIHEPYGPDRSEHESFAQLRADIKLLPEYFIEANYDTYAFFQSRDYYLDSAMGFSRGVKNLFPYGLNSFQSANNICEKIAAAKGKNFFFIHSKRPHLPYVLPAPYNVLFGKRKTYPLLPSTPEDLQLRKEKGRPNNFRNAMHGIPGIFPDQINFLKEVQKGDEAHRIERIKEVAALYDSALRLTDDYLGVVISCIKKKYADDALIVITSDHGEELYEKNKFSHNHPYETVLRIPMIFHMPTKLDKKIAVPARAQLVDLVPTILDIAGLKTKVKYDGISLLPFMRKDADISDISKRPIFSQTFRKTPPAAHAVIYENWKYIDFYLLKRTALYDISIDKEEKNDLSLVHPELVRSLRKKLRESIN